MSRLRLIYNGEYNNDYNDALNGNLTFGDDALNGEVIFKYDNTKNVLTLGVSLTWNTHLMHYYKNQVVAVKCITFEKYPKIIKSKSIILKGILNKKDNKVSWPPTKFQLKNLYSNILWKVRLAIPETRDLQYLPTIQEIKQEISKLSQEEIEKERKEYNEYLKNGDPWLIYESLEEKIINYLIKEKKKNKQMF